MFFRTIFLLSALLLANFNLQAGFIDNIKGAVSRQSSLPTVDVLILKDRQKVTLEVKGKYRLIDPNTQRQISKRFLGKSRQIEALPSGLKWGEEFPGIYQLHIIPEERGDVTSIDGNDYRGSIFIYDIGGAISIVNRVTIEDYLNSVLPERVQHDWDNETLAAFVIAARTYAYYYAQNPPNKYWSLDADKVGYKGMQTVDFSSEVARAIKNTRRMVLSKTGKYEGVITPFAAVWDAQIAGGRSKRVVTRISLWEANDMARKGRHAAQILAAAFPGSHIEVIN